METKIKNEEILSRRGFFKKAAKSALPIITLTGMLSLQSLFTSQAIAADCQDCSGACKGCEGGCRGSCEKSCGDGCTTASLSSVSKGNSGNVMGVSKLKK